MSTGRAAALVLAAACAGCAGGHRYVSTWDGRRGYDGTGDYGYDLAASRSEARGYRALAARSYPAPGTPDDPWGPYIREAASRFQVPERWIREVMFQESGGRLYDTDGSPITSPAGAMGLMQVMPQTYDMLRQRLGLASDPYDPHDNVLAGAAYIREMYDRYGSPAFLAAYNAGPDRLDAYLSEGDPLPEETVNYLASVAPRLGTDVAMSGPLAVYAGGNASAGSGQAFTPDADRAYAGGGMVGQDYDASRQMATASDDPSDRAFDGGGLVTPSAPTGILTATTRPADQATTPAQAMDGGPTTSRTTTVATPVAASVAATAMRDGDWGIQVGAYPDPANSDGAIRMAKARANELLATAQPTITTVWHGGILYRARLVGLSAGNAAAACARLSGQGLDCVTVPPGS